MVGKKCKENVRKWVVRRETYREAIKTVMLGLGYQGSMNADISCGLEGLWNFCFFSKSRERLLTPFGWGSGSC